jgi:hypothetical protein
MNCAYMNHASRSCHNFDERRATFMSAEATSRPPLLCHTQINSRAYSCLRPSRRCCTVGQRHAQSSTLGVLSLQVSSGHDREALCTTVHEASHQACSVHKHHSIGSLNYACRSSGMLLLSRCSHATRTAARLCMKSRHGSISRAGTLPLQLEGRQER